MKILIPCEGSDENFGDIDGLSFSQDKPLQGSKQARSPPAGRPSELGIETGWSLSAKLLEGILTEGLIHHRLWNME